MEEEEAAEASKQAQSPPTPLPAPVATSGNGRYCLQYINMSTSSTRSCEREHSGDASERGQMRARTEGRGTCTRVRVCGMRTLTVTHATDGRTRSASVRVR
jgi:hypothetical protein